MREIRLTIIADVARHFSIVPIIIIFKVSRTFSIYLIREQWNTVEIYKFRRTVCARERERESTQAEAFATNARMQPRSEWFSAVRWTWLLTLMLAASLTVAPLVWVLVAMPVAHADTHTHISNSRRAHSSRASVGTKVNDMAINCRWTICCWFFRFAFPFNFNSLLCAQTVAGPFKIII